MSDFSFPISGCTQCLCNWDMLQCLIQLPLPQSLHCSDWLQFSPLGNAGVFSLHLPSWWQYISLWDAGCSGILCHTRGSIVYNIIDHSIITVVTSLQQIRYLRQREDSQQHAYLWKCCLLPKYHVSMSRKAAVAVEDSRSCQFPSVPQEGNVALCKAGQPRDGFPGLSSRLSHHGKKWEESSPMCRNTGEPLMFKNIKMHPLL